MLRPSPDYFAPNRERRYLATTKTVHTAFSVYPRIANSIESSFLTCYRYRRVLLTLRWAVSETSSVFY